VAVVDVYVDDGPRRLCRGGSCADHKSCGKERASHRSRPSKIAAGKDCRRHPS
jgi:hypothetical protein